MYKKVFKRANVKKFVVRNKKQIIFALFALIYSFFDNNTEVYKSVAPVVVAEGVKAAKTGAEAIKAAKAAKEAGETAKMVKEGAKAAKEINTAAQTAKMARDEIKNEEDTGEKMKKAATTGAALNMALRNESTSTSSSSMPVVNKNKSKNVNPNPEAFSHQSSLDSGVEIPKKRRGLFATIGGLTDNKESKGEVEEEISFTEDKNVVQKVGIVPKIGCLIALPIIFIMAIPMIIVGGAMPVSNVMSEAECLIGDNDCEEETASYITKFRNFVKYGSFASNSEVLSKKVTETYEKIYDEYDFIIDMPLLIATITVDLDSSKKVEDEDKILVSEDMMERLKYIEDLAKMQMVEG
ncbi:MAG: hypothetical protein IKP79_00775, partial [Bacilli bacterium]|nr:hypothetical protein [Bacilli bacterium]